MQYLWAERMKEKEDYQALAAIFNSTKRDYEKDKKEELAKGILYEAKDRSLPAIIRECSREGFTSWALAKLLIEIGNPKAVPLLKKKLDRGNYDYCGSDRDCVQRFVDKYPELHGEIERIICAICGEEKTVKEMKSYNDKWFCPGKCWSRRGRVLQSGIGKDCPYYDEGVCRAGGRDTGLCSLQVGSYLISCYVYSMYRR